jgi:hypothetical protein
VMLQGDEDKEIDAKDIPDDDEEELVESNLMSETFNI